MQKLAAATQIALLNEGATTDASLLRTIVNGLVDPVLVIGLDHQILMINEAAQELVGNRPALCVGKTCHEVFHHCSHPCDTTGSVCLIEEMRFAKKPLQLKKTHRRHDGTVLHFEISAFPILDAADNIQAVVEICRNVTRRVEAEDALTERDRRLQYLALHDSLTGLGNRTFLLEKLTDAAARAASTGEPFAFLFLDLDGFRPLNETLGHRKGDLILKEVARRLHAGFADSCTIARLGADEFGIVLERMESVPAVRCLARDILDSLSAMMIIGDDRIYVTGSIGIAIFPQDAPDVEGLLAAAEMAMARLKSDDRDDCRFFTAEMVRRGHNAIQLEADLRESLVKEDLVVHYQPIFDLQSGRLTGAEALVRWQHPVRGFVFPGDFIPVAEETGLIVPLGDYVLRHVCRDLAGWLAEGLIVPQISINVSARQFRQANMVELVSKRLQESGIAAHLIDLEVTETTLMTDVEAAVQVMKELKQVGVGLTIDDFGTGYSSLAYLRKFPIDKLKIDYGFVADVVHDENSAAIASAVIALAQSMNLAVVAEGIETDAQIDFLRAKQCALGQGYLFSRPIAAKEFVERFLAPGRTAMRRLPGKSVEMGAGI